MKMSSFRFFWFSRDDGPDLETSEDDCPVLLIPRGLDLSSESLHRPESTVVFNVVTPPSEESDPVLGRLAMFEEMPLPLIPFASLSVVIEDMDPGLP